MTRVRYQKVYQRKGQHGLRESQTPPSFMGCDGLVSRFLYFFFLFLFGFFSPSRPQMVTGYLAYSPGPLLYEVGRELGERTSK